jgi:hypothetical protein
MNGANGAKLAYLVTDTFISHFDAKIRRDTSPTKDLRVAEVFGKEEKSVLTLNRP